MNVNANDPERVVMRRADGKPINVLVVDDEPVLAELVSMALRYEGWEIADGGRRCDRDRAGQGKPARCRRARRDVAGYERP